MTALSPTVRLDPSVLERVPTSIVPSADDIYYLGAPGIRWRALYVGIVFTREVFFANGWKITEAGDALVFINPYAKRVLMLKPDGTLERLK